MSATFPELEFKPLVVGAPRSGFSLLTNVISHLYALTGGKQGIKRKVLKAYTNTAGWEISKEIIRVFKKYSINDELIYNRNFQELLGGPKWLDPKQPQRACFRKYIGVKGLGDFTLIISHPREILDNYEVVHSHYNPELWVRENYYNSYVKFASVRNPVDVVNSSCFSINALTSEYIQKFIPASMDNDELRQHLALYKLTDMDFFRGLISPLKKYMEEYISCSSEYIPMKWERLIKAPVETIIDLSDSANIRIDEELAKTIWDDIKYKNLTAAHKHNYRVGHGKVNGWCNTLVNEHLEIMREEGLEEICTDLGYDPIANINESSYSEYQKKISNYIKKNKVYTDYPDKDLFDFAFNKSNLDSSKFTQFKCYEQREHTQVERSCFTDEALLNEVWDVAENTAKKFNEQFSELFSKEYSSEKQSSKIINAVFNKTDWPRKRESLIKSIVKDIGEVIDPPRLLFREKRWSIVAYGNMFYGVPRPLGQINLENDESRKRFGIIRSDNLLVLKDRMRSQTKGYRYWTIFIVSKVQGLLFLMNKQNISHV